MRDMSEMENKVVIIDDEKNVKDAKELQEYCKKLDGFRRANKKDAKNKFMESLSEKEKLFLAKMSKKERRKFINKSNGLKEDHGVNGPFGKKYF